MQMLRVEMFIPREPVHEYMRLRQQVVDEVGGLTEYQAIGHWVGESTLYCEGVYVFLFFVEDTEDNILWVEKIAREYKEAAGQECVMYVLNGRDVIFIED